MTKAGYTLDSIELDSRVSLILHNISMTDSEGLTYRLIKNICSLVVKYELHFN